MIPIQIIVGSKVPIYIQIKNQIIGAIIDGTLQPGQQLPSIRILAKELQIGIITCKRVYDDLIAEKMLVSQPGKGVFVAQIDRQRLPQEYIKALIDDIDALIQHSQRLGISKEDLMQYLTERYQQYESEH